MSMLGLLAGAGDAARSQNAQNAETQREKSRLAEKRRDAFADDLRRVMESDEWPEKAREAAAHMRTILYSDDKVKEKDYDKMWSEVHKASIRAGVPNREAAGAASDLPALQSLQGKLTGSQGVPAPAQDSLTMRRPPESSMDLLRPESSMDLLRQEGDVMGGTGMTLSQPAPPVNSILAPPTIAQNVQGGIAGAQRTIAANPVQPLSGRFTRGEKNAQAAAQMEAAQQQQLDFFRKKMPLEIDQYRQQQEIAAANRPDKFIIGADGQLVLNQTTGTTTPTGVVKQEKLSDSEQDIQDRLTAAGLPDNAANRIAMSEQKLTKELAIRKSFQNNGGDANDPDGFKAMTIFNMNENRRAQFENQRIIRVEALKGDYNKQKENASLSIRYANALKAAVQEASLGGDLGVIFSAMRMLDPGSVVREQEYRVGQSLGGPFHTFIGKMNQLTGRGILDSKVRQEFNQLADMMIRLANKDYLGINNLYMSMADARGLPLEMVGFSGPSTYKQGTTKSQVTPFAPMLPGNTRNPAGPPSKDTTEVDNSPAGRALAAILKKLEE